MISLFYLRTFHHRANNGTLFCGPQFCIPNLNTNGPHPCVLIPVSFQSRGKGEHRDAVHLCPFVSICAMRNTQLASRTRRTG